MNTLIHLWIEPLIMNHERGKDKLYFNQIILGDYSELDTDKLEQLICGDHLQDIMDAYDIESNWDYGVLWATATEKSISIKWVDSPEQRQEKKTVKKINKEIAKIVTNNIPLKLNTSNVEIQDGGKINVSIPSLRISDSIDFSKIWDIIENNIIGKINKGDSIVLTDDDGNNILEMTGGSFLNISMADLNVYDTKKMGKNPSLADKMEALKGGVFLREDGSLDIGDAERTFYLKIYTDKLLKASLKLNKSLTDITQQKLLPTSNPI